MVRRGDGEPPCFIRAVAFSQQTACGTFLGWLNPNTYFSSLTFFPCDFHTVSAKKAPLWTFANSLRKKFLCKADSFGTLWWQNSFQFLPFNVTLFPLVLLKAGPLLYYHSYLSDSPLCSHMPTFSRQLVLFCLWQGSVQLLFLTQSSSGEHFSDLISIASFH